MDIKTPNQPNQPKTVDPNRTWPKWIKQVLHLVAEAN